MNRKNALSLVAATTFWACTMVPGQTAFADTDPNEGPAVTVYSTADPASFDPQQYIAQQRQGHNPNYAWQVPGFGVVKVVRRVNLEAGLNELRFTDVAQFIDPTTVSFTDLDDPDGTAVLEQNFEFDLVSPEKLMEKYIDREISVVLTRGEVAETVTGTLLSAGRGKLVLMTPEGIRIISGHGQQVKLGELPGGLITKPTLVWKLQAAQAGEHHVRTTYQTSGITWRADYNLILGEPSAISHQPSADKPGGGGAMKADLGAWVTLMNLSGAGYENARLKLIAGDVQRIRPQSRMAGLRGKAMYPMAAEDTGFQEKAFFEYHLYTLPRRTDILSNTTQQITLFPTARDIDVEKVLVYYGLPQAASWRYVPQPMRDRNLGGQSNKKVDVYVRFKNEKPNRLGMPLPKGKVRAYKRDDADGTLEFIGEDLIDHTAKDEEVLIKLGQAFDVVGERTQTDFSIDKRAHVITESFRIELRNHKPQPQKVIIKENLYRWTNWEIVETSDKYKKIDARTIHFEVIVAADGKKTVAYTVRYTW